MLKKYLPVRPSKIMSFLLVGFMLFIYLLDNLSNNSIINFTLYNNVIKPVLWISLAGFVWLLPRIRSKVYLKQKVSICWYAFNFALINILILIAAGFIDGFGKSPYDHSVYGFFINILSIGVMLVGREAARSNIINSLADKERFLVFIPTALLMTVCNYTINRFSGFKGVENIVIFAAQFLAPEFLQNLLATYLVFLGGWIPALIYMGIIQAFNWLSPVLPNLKWITAALVGIICPVFSLLVLQKVYSNKAKTLKKIKKKAKAEESTLGWMITSILSIAIIWFVVGVFPIYPSVIATGSMEPMIKPGDVIIIEKVLKNEDIDLLKVGDVIQFKRGSILISHRIIEIMEIENVKNYRTKGDNNSGPDIEIVKPEDVKGTIKYVVPKIGWPTLILKQEKDLPMEEVKF